MSALVVETLSTADIASNLRLCNSVGWPDTEAEWRVIHEAALVLGVRRDGQLLGQGALGLYPGAGSIAKMVVAPDARRNGIGAAILDALLNEAARRSLPVVGLVATALGRPPDLVDMQGRLGSGCELRLDHFRKAENGGDNVVEVVRCRLPAIRSSASGAPVPVASSISCGRARETHARSHWTRRRPQAAAPAAGRPCPIRR